MLVWFITGASRGFGRVWAEAALKRGDRVAATARDESTLSALVDSYGDAILPVRLDVTDRDAAVAAVAAAHEHFGRLDVVVNNAGYGHFGFVEELSEAEVRAQMETNFFGALWVTQAALPFLRRQGSGHILQVSSIGGVTAYPRLGAYHASKWALEGLSQTLSEEVASFGIKVTLVEPGPFGTDWSGASAVHSGNLDAYDDVREQVQRARGARTTAVSAPPETTAEAILTLVDSSEPPMRFFLGRSPFAAAIADYGKRMQEWARWQTISESARR
ncbi:SDR family NAD(P)-dependent oxidoreductase [Streptomyces sp. SID8382]|uniref:oxidoreductase n=1 Tax=Streptomyces malaysiensis TaxID=92644 RepID=UPI000C2C7D93|nr:MULTISPECIES: oxidoreductase [unclassified Streptomyces]AUA08206.1 3-oxoacyl-[acyl-carrier-protein] reductase FabG [Streptomyces sp. M56]MYX62560.1 SDR family NAD(P)-dependent oxidoreductase [Streptomyces sp. SID8382]